MPSGGGGAGGARRSAASPLARSSEAPSHGRITDTDMGTAIRPTATAIRPTATATDIRLTATAIQRTTATHGRLITAMHVIGRGPFGRVRYCQAPARRFAQRPGGASWKTH